MRNTKLIALSLAATLWTSSVQAGIAGNVYLNLRTLFKDGENLTVSYEWSTKRPDNIFARICLCPCAFIFDFIGNAIIMGSNTLPAELEPMDRHTADKLGLSDSERDELNFHLDDFNGALDELAATGQYLESIRPRLVAHTSEKQVQTFERYLKTGLQ